MSLKGSASVMNRFPSTPSQLRPRVPRPLVCRLVTTAKGSFLDSPSRDFAASMVDEVSSSLLSGIDPSEVIVIPSTRAVRDEDPFPLKKPLIYLNKVNLYVI